MARQKTPADPLDEVAPEKHPRAAIDRNTRKIVNLLKEIGNGYRAAGAALATGNEVAFEAEMELIASYAELYAKLTRKHNEAITAEGLAAVAES